MAFSLQVDMKQMFYFPELYSGSHLISMETIQLMEFFLFDQKLQGEKKKKKHLLFRQIGMKDRYNSLAHF